MRLKTAIENRYLYHIYVRHEGSRSVSDFYFNEDKVLTKHYRSTKTRMLKTMERGLYVELAFWRRVLRSKSTTIHGLRAANQRIKHLCSDLGLSSTAMKKDRKIYLRARTRRRAINELQNLRSNAYYEGSHYSSGSVFRMRRFLKEGGFSLRHIGTSESEIKELRRVGALRAAKNQLQWLRSPECTCRKSPYKELQILTRRWSFTHDELETSDTEMQNFLSEKPSISLEK